MKPILSILVVVLLGVPTASAAATGTSGIYQHAQHVIWSDGYWYGLEGDEPGPESAWIEFPHAVVYDKYLFSVAYEPAQPLRLSYELTSVDLTPRIGAYAYEPLYYIAYDGNVQTPYVSLTDEYMGFAWYIDYGNLDQAPDWFVAADFEAELDRVWGEALAYAKLTEVDPPLYHTLPSSAWGVFRLERDDWVAGQPLSGTLHGMIVTTQIIPEPSWLAAVALVLALWLGHRYYRPPITSGRDRNT